MNCDQPAECPIQDVKRFLILARKFRTGPKQHSGWTTNADVHRRRQTIRIMLRPFGGSFPETVVGTADGMEDANRPIPGCSPVPFHVAIEAENLTVVVKRNVVGIALAGCKKFGIFSVSIHANNEPAGRLSTGPKAVSILCTRKHKIVGIIAMRRSGEKIGRQVHKIAADHIELLIRAKHDRMSTMLPRAPFPFAKEFNAVKYIFAFSIAAAEQ